MTLALLLALCSSAAVTRAHDALVVVNDVTDPVSLDPHREFDASSDNIVNQLFDGLVRLSPAGEVEPALALSWRRVDALTLEFTLREGVRFHNGEPFDAEAVRFSVARQLDPARPAPNAALLGAVTVEVVSPSVVRLKTAAPDGVLLNKLPMFVKILPPRYLKEKGDEGFAAHPVGTGPFEFVRWDRGREIELKANGGYWMAGAPRVSRLVFRFLPTGLQLGALRSGEVDMITDLSGLDTLKVATDPALKVVKAENFYGIALVFNSRRAPLSDPRAREGLAHLIDARELIRYGARGNGRPLSSFTMPGQFGHDETVEGYRHDHERAAALLRAAGLGPGRKLRMMVREEIKNFGLIIISQLKRAGLEVEYEVATQEKVFRSVVAPNLSGGPGWDGDILLSHFVDPTAHIYFPYLIFVHSKGPYSLAGDAEFDALFEEMVRTQDAVRQRELCRELERLVRRKALAYSPLQVVRPFATRKKLRYEPYVTGMLDFRTAYWEDS